jgi:hypothetical protein
LKSGISPDFQYLFIGVFTLGSDDKRKTTFKRYHRKDEVGRPIFISNKLTVVPRGERFVSQDVSQLWEMFDQMFKLLGIMPIPWCDGEPMDHTSVDVDTDVEFDTVLAFSLSFDPDVVPGAAVMGAESSGVHCDVHLFPSKKPSDPIHHLPNVDDGESFHPSLDHTMPRHIWTAFFDSLAIFEVRLDAIVGLVESYFEETPYGDGLWVVSLSSFFVGFPGW